MRVITITELRRLTRTQLYSLQVQMQSVLVDLPAGSVEHEFIRATLENIRAVLGMSGLCL